MMADVHAPPTVNLSMYAPSALAIIKELHAEQMAERHTKKNPIIKAGYRGRKRMDNHISVGQNKVMHDI